MVQKSPIPSDRLLATERLGCSERGANGSSGPRFLCACSALPMSGWGFGTATRHALEECMRAFVRQPGNVSKARLHIAKEKQDLIR